MCAEKPEKMELCSCELTAEQKEVIKYIFESILNSGKAPTIKEMEASLKRSDKDIISTLNELERNDLILRKTGTQDITSIYPFSLVPTQHQVVLEDGRKLFAMCAVDSLGMPVMFKRDVKILSRCERCKTPIKLVIKNEEIESVSLPDILIWRLKEKLPRPAETCCPKVNFFCSEKDLKEWEAENPDLAKIGYSLKLKEAFPEIRKCWKRYGELVGVR